MTEELLRLDGIGKDYPKMDHAGGRLRTIFRLLSGTRAPESFRALHNIGFALNRGESLGIIGENGAGKSTLLKIIAGVIRPSRGSLRVSGRVGALLELGSGFHPEYTGLENIDLSAALYGLSVGEIRRKREEIIAFADIGEQIGQPLKHYSSGMVARLGFAVATVMRPDILITDEVLAVGDEAFQKKCIAWLEGYLSDGGTLLLCSHSMFHIQKLCRRAAWLQQGEMRHYGNTADVTQAYLTYQEEKSRKERPGEAVYNRRSSDAGAYAVQNLWLENSVGERTAIIRSGEDFAICGSIHSPDQRVPVVALGLLRAEGTPVYGTLSDIDGFRPNRLATNLYGFTMRILATPLLPGRYSVRAAAIDPEGLRVFDTVECVLDVMGESREFGYCRLAHAWEPGRLAELPAPAGTAS
jgi:lipopolysaccharide transport system ATP-binding protein